MAKSKTKPFVCQDCGAEYAKWVGKCLECGQWNSVSEVLLLAGPLSAGAEPIRLLDVEASGPATFHSTHISFLDRVVGGKGCPLGTVLFLAGEPGIGKSTLLFQMMSLQNERGLYVSAEESVSQIAHRFKGFGGKISNELFIVSENRLFSILQQMDRLKPKVVVIDSIQMILSEDDARVRGGFSTLREVMEALVQKAKSLGITLWVVGHVNKEGDIAGPKTLEHLVDVVLTFSSVDDSRFRILQAQKNRFGPSGEFVFLEMSETGLSEKTEVDSFWNTHHGQSVSGCALAPIVMGSRILLVEIQALVVPSYFPSPRRSTSGFDMNRLYLLLAVLEKKLKIRFSTLDVYLNIVGGLRISDPSADLAVAAALVSAHTERSIPLSRVYCAEIGLTGELRPGGASRDRFRLAQNQGKTNIYTAMQQEAAEKSGNAHVMAFKGIEDALKDLCSGSR